MIWIDYVFIAILLVGLVFGLFTSVALQVINLISVLAGLVAAGLVRGDLADWLCSKIQWLGEHPAVTHRAVYIVIFLGVVGVAQLVGHLARKLMKASDRALAAVIGLVAALFLCVAIPALMIPAQGEREEELMKRSVLMPYLARGVERTQGFLKPETRERIKEFARQLWEQTGEAAQQKLGVGKAGQEKTGGAEAAPAPVKGEEKAK